MNLGLVALAYHQATSHTVEEVSARCGLDWDKQPPAFKEYPGTLRVELPLPEGEPQPSPLSLESLGQLLYLTCGLTGVKEYPGFRYYLRAAPSAGALYPIEAYLSTPGLPGLEGGLYHYAPQGHTLERLGDLLGPNLILYFSAIFYRSSWKYLGRSYRYCLLDAGHILGNLEEAALRLGLPLTIRPDFIDETVNADLGLDGEGEAALCLATMGDTESNAYAQGMASSIHQASSLTGGNIPEVFLPPFGAMGSYPLGETIRKRRSTRDFEGKAISLDEFIALTEDAFSPSLTLYAVANRVDGLERGLYRVETGKLVHLRFGDYAKYVGSLCLGQDLVTNAAAVFVFTARFPTDRAYRHTHLEAGRRSEKVYLAATAGGVGISGIGAFFDKPLATFLGVEEGEYPIYVTVVGI